MKHILLALALVFPVAIPAADPGDEIVEMCHGGVTIQVMRRFVPRRLQLGDTLGPCDCCGTRTGIVFDKPAYSVTAGQPFEAKVCICPVPAAGLFSYGVEVTLTGLLSGTGLVSTVPLPLNFHTVRGPGADTTARALTVAAKGSVDFFAQTLTPYREQIIATVQVPALPPGNYTLDVRPRNDLGSTEQIFIDGQGTVLDPALTYSPAQIVVTGTPAPPSITPSFLARLIATPGPAFGATELALEFVADPGRQYFVQYSADLAEWTTVLPAITGQSATLQWIDTGPPETDPAPTEVASRFYRLLRLQP